MTPSKPAQLLAAIMIATLILGGCTKVPDEPLRIGTNVWIGYEPLYLARSLGYLEPDRVKLVEYVSSTQTMRGLMDGTIDAGALTLDETLQLYQQGLDIRIVLVMDYSNGADALVTRPDIKTLQEIKGKRIGIESTAMGAYIMHRILDKAQLTLNDVTLISLEQSQHEQAYLNGTVDGLVGFDPVRSRLINHGAHTLIDSREFPGEIIDILVIRGSAIEKHKHHLQHLLKQWFVTLKQIKSSPDEISDRLNQRMKLSQEQLKITLDEISFPNMEENRHVLNSPQQPLRQQTAQVANLMIQNRLLQNSISMEPLFDTMLLQELYPQ